ncbi:MAG: radical SAM family heme chaperone HemW [Candidatus Poribacteria bacterium]|nr:radical SAM family heme chaperone HemW [Candidatus Poribacteria bacterium]
MPTFQVGIPRALYIHIPFCATRCYYCDFNTYTFHKELSKVYLSALGKEMEWYVQGLSEKPTLDTIFIGGGTPSILSAESLAYLFNLLHHHFSVSNRTELTVECNPGTVDQEKLEVMRSAGVNRLSFGVQAMQDSLLESIGRVHKSDDVRHSLDLARQTGVQNINLDLIFALPGQTLEQWQQTLETVIRLSPEHISTYNLTLAHGTQFYDLWENGNLKLADNDLEAEMYQYAITRLTDADYQHYEISNFSRPKYEPRHNLVYWNNQAYFGLGAGACGYIDGYRYTNLRGVKEYITEVRQGTPISSQEKLVGRARKAETLMLGLRKLAGISQEAYQQCFGEPIDAEFGAAVEQFKNQDLLQWTENRLHLTPKGLMVADQIFLEFT